MEISLIKNLITEIEVISINKFLGEKKQKTFQRNLHVVCDEILSVTSKWNCIDQTLLDVYLKPKEFVH